MLNQLIARIAGRDAVVAVIGLGYVGLPLAVVFAEAGFSVIGIDIDRERVDRINRGESPVEDISHARLVPLLEAGLLRASDDPALIAQCQAVSICVPTPLSKTGDPDVSYIAAAATSIGHWLQPGMLIVLESTTYPGSTREILLRRLEEAQPALRVGEDFFVCFSPERVDPGRHDWTTRNTPKVLGGITAACRMAGQALYGSAIDRIVPVSSPEAAEMTKLLENTFRAVNIGLANELLLMCERLGLDAWEVIEAAASKPFGFMKFVPGPGLGGHCIPIDPLYLSWKLRTLNYTARFIELASEINTGMPRYWVQRVQDALNDVGKPLKGSTVLVLGVAYKADISDLRESPALDILHLLRDRGARISYHDPHIPQVHYDGLHLSCIDNLDDALQAADCVVIATDHRAYDWEAVAAQARLLVDTRHVVRSGLGVTV